MKFIKLLFVFIAVVTVFLYLRIRKSNDFEPQIKNKLAEIVSNASDGLYKLDIDRIEIDITSASITANNILLLPDSVRMSKLEKAGALSNDIYMISFKSLQLEGISALALLKEKEIKLGKLVLDSPEVRITHKNRHIEKDSTGNLYQRVAKLNQSIRIENLMLKNIRFVFTNLDKNKSVTSFKDISASFTNIRIDSSTINDSTRFLFAKDAVLFLKGFTQVTAQKSYDFTIDSLTLKPQNGQLQFFEMRLKPKETRKDFIAKLPYMQDMYDIRIEEGMVKNINWFSLLAGDGFLGEELYLNKGFVKVYNDRSLPPGPSKKSSFPHQKIMNVDVPLSMKKILLNNLFVSYEEFNPESQHTGIVEFHHAGGEINNLTNIEEEIKINPFITIQASANFMNAAKLDAIFKFDLINAGKGLFSVEASLGSMEGNKLNKITEGLALIKVNSLQVDHLQFSMQGTNTKGKGKVLMAYHDLSFDVLKHDTEKDGLKKSGLLSFIANKIIVKKANPSQHGGVVKKYEVVHEHDPSRSFFNLIWKTLLNGILETVK